MDEVGLYIIAEEQISSLNKSPKEALEVYNIAVSLLDRNIKAWYKTTDWIEANELLRKKLNLNPGDDIPYLRALLTIPWFCPIISYLEEDEGIIEDVSRPSLLTYCPNYLVKERNFVSRRVHSNIQNPENVIPKRTISEDGKYRFVWKMGIPEKNYKVLGIVFSPFTFHGDGEIYDFIRFTTGRDRYSLACSAIIETGYKHVRNVPKAGFVKSTVHRLCKFGMNRLFSEWTVNFQGSLFKDSGFRRFIGTFPRSHDTSFEVHKRYVLMGMWKNEEQSNLVCKKLFHQIRGVMSWNYFGTQLDLRSDPIGRKFPIEKVEQKPITREIKPKTITRSYSILFKRLLSSIIMEAVEESDDEELLEKLQIVKNYTGKGPKITLANRDKLLKKIDMGIESYGLTPENFIIQVIKKGSVNKKIYKKLQSINLPTTYDYRKVRQINRLTELVRISKEISDKQKILRNLEKRIVIIEHLCYERTTHSYVFCEHVLYELRMIAKKIKVFKKESAVLDSLDYEIKLQIIEKFAEDPTAALTISKGLEKINPTIIECRYCGQDLGTIWFTVNSDMMGEIMRTKKGSDSYKDDDYGEILALLVGKGVIETRVSPFTLTSILKEILAEPLDIEIDKIYKVGGTDAGIKGRFLLIVSIISLLHTLSKIGAPIVVHEKKIQEYMTTNHMDILKVVGQIRNLESIILSYWGASLAKLYNDPDKILRNAIAIMLETEVTDLEIKNHLDLIQYPLRDIVEKNKKDIINWTRKEVEQIKSEWKYRYFRMIADFRPLLTHATPPPIFPIRMKHWPEYYKPGIRYHSVKLSNYKGKLIIDREVQFDQTEEEKFLSGIKFICPEVLLHPIKTDHKGYFIRLTTHDWKILNKKASVGGSKYERKFKSKSKFKFKSKFNPTEDEMVANIEEAERPTEEKREEILEFEGSIIDPEEADEVIGLGQGPFEIEVAKSRITAIMKCSRCGLLSNYTYDKAYYKKYKSCIDLYWTRIESPKSIPVKPISGKPILSKLEIPNMEIPDARLHNNVDKKIMKSFSEKFKWNHSPDPLMAEELGFILLSQGYKTLGLELIKSDIEKFKEAKMVKKLITGWNLFAEWGTGQPIELISKLLRRFTYAIAS